MAGLLRRWFGRGELPAGFDAELAADERVLAAASLAGGGHVVVTSWGIWVPSDDGAAPLVGGAARPRRVGWHLVSRATWKSGAIELVEADERETVGGAVVLTDRAPRRLRLSAPGRVPEQVRARVNSSIRSRHHRDLPGGGAWFVQRRVAGRDGVVLQVRPDPGTDPAVAAQVAADVAATLGIAGRGGGV